MVKNLVPNRNLKPGMNQYCKSTELSNDEIKSKFPIQGRNEESRLYGRCK